MVYLCVLLMSVVYF